MIVLSDVDMEECGRELQRDGHMDEVFVLMDWCDRVKLK